FDRPMNWESVVAAFSIEPPTAGRFEWEETTFVFWPHEPLQSLATYTVTIAPSALDDTGRPVLSEPYAWTFQTGVPYEVADFGWGPNAQVLDADGRRAVHFRLFGSVSLSLTFELYRVTLPQFLDRYASGFRGVAEWEKRPISLEGAIRARQWEVVARNNQEWPAPGEVIIPADVPPRPVHPEHESPRHRDDRPVVPHPDPPRPHPEAGRGTDCRLAHRHQRRARRRGRGRRLRPRRHPGGPGHHRRQWRLPDPRSPGPPAPDRGRPRGRRHHRRRPE
ncbi:MAG: Ig-like domain-containing protein, partial [Chloroflexi bacterium]|nr:Ig-like domain-containing protein [Chloroflexota bacterium]